MNGPEQMTLFNERPTIDVSNELHVLTREAMDALIRQNESRPRNFVVYRRGNVLTRLVNGGTQLGDYEAASFRERLSEVVAWEKSTAKSTRPAFPPKEVVDALLRRAEYPDLPEIIRVVDVPMFGADGSLPEGPGYHAASKTFFRPAPGMERIKFTGFPSIGEVRDACRHLDHLLQDFPFDSKASRANALALMFTPFVREMIDGPTPFFPVEAPQVGTGKGLLTRVLLAPAVGTPVFTKQGETEEEWAKLILAKLIAGPPVVIFDNVSGKLKSAALELALTASTYEGRILGASKTASCPVRTVWTATLNNAQFSVGVARRSARIKMDAEMEKPWLRDTHNFAIPHLDGHVVNYRAALVSDILTVIMGWIGEGEEIESKMIMGSFERWAAVVGGILEFIGCEGFLANEAELYEEAAVEGVEWAAFLTDLAAKGPTTAAQIELEYSQTGPEALRLAISRRTSVGYVLRSHRDRIYGNHVLRYANGRWRADVQDPLPGKTDTRR